MVVWPVKSQRETLAVSMVAFYLQLRFELACLILLVRVFHLMHTTILGCCSGAMVRQASKLLQDDLTPKISGCVHWTQRNHWGSREALDIVRRADWMRMSTCFTTMPCSLSHNDCFIVPAIHCITQRPRAVSNRDQCAVSHTRSHIFGHVFDHPHLHHSEPLSFILLARVQHFYLVLWCALNGNNANCY